MGVTGEGVGVGVGVAGGPSVKYMLPQKTETFCAGPEQFAKGVMVGVVVFNAHVVVPFQK